MRRFPYKENPNKGWTHKLLWVYSNGAVLYLWTPKQEQVIGPNVIIKD